MGRREDNSLRKQKRQSLIGFGLLSLLFLVVLLLIRFSFFDAYFNKIYSPAWYVTDKISEVWQGEFIPLTKSKKTLWYENQLYLKALENNLVDKNEIQLLKLENEKLKTALNNLEASGINNSTLAPIISNDGVPWFSTLIVSLPENHNHKVSDLVYAEGNVLLGYLSSVEKKSATVRLFSGNGEVTQVAVKSSGLFLDLKGRGGVNYEIHLPREIKLENDEILVSPKSSLVQVAIIGDTLFDPRDPYQTVLATVPVNPMQLSQVYIEKK